MRRIYISILCLSLSILATQTVAQISWEHTDGPEGGATWFITSNDEYLFYPDRYFLYRSADGVNWERLPVDKIWRIAGYGQSLVAFRSHFDHLGERHRGLTVSHDNGDTWSEGTAPPSPNLISSMVICPHGIYVPDGQSNVLYRSVDDGLTWETLTPPMQSGREVALFSDRLYLYGLSQIWQSDLSGDTWTSITPPIHPQEYLRGFIAQGEHFVITTTLKVWYSHNGGQSWQFHSTPWPGQYEELALVGDHVYAVGGLTWLAMSDDFGITWTGLPADRILNSLTALGGELYGCTFNSGVVRWDSDGQIFTPVNTSLYSAAVYNMDFDGEVLWAATGTGVDYYDPVSEIWIKTTLKEPGFEYKYLAAVAPGHVYVVGEEYNLHVTTDYGMTWTSIPSLPVPIDQMHLQVFDDVLLYGSGIYLLRSTNGGQSWDDIHLPFGVITNIVRVHQRLYCAGTGGIVFSDNKGLSWSQTTTQPALNPEEMGAAGDLVFLFSKMGTKDYRLYCSLNGVDWQYAHDGLPSIDYLPGAIFKPYSTFFYEDGVYFLHLASRGTFVSLDTARTWIPVDYDKFYAVEMYNGVMYGGTFGGGVVKGVVETYGTLVSGNVFSDDDGNGIQDNEESVMPGVVVGVTASERINPYYFTTTNHHGDYALGVIPSSSDTLRPVIHSKYIQKITPPYVTTEFAGTDLNFGIQFIPDANDLYIHSFLGFPRPGFEVSQTVTYFNAGTTTQDATISVKLDPLFELVTADPPPAFVFGDSLIWFVYQLPMLTSGKISLRLYLPADVPLGAEVHQVSRISSDETDLTPEDNLHIASRIVVGSCDPNTKEVHPAEGLTEKEIEEGKEVLYTVLFQNIGTYHAERVRIIDVIDTAFFLPSIRLIASSHEITSFKLNPGGLLEIVFDNINLPDSLSNEPESQGFVTFAVLRKKVFSRSVPVLNKASIYFDFNEPIITNLVSFTVREESTVATKDHKPRGGDLTIFPNPNQGIFWIQNHTEFDGFKSLTIYDLNGRIRHHVDNTEIQQHQFHIQTTLPNGVYFIMARGGRDGSRVARMIVYQRE